MSDLGQNYADAMFAPMELTPEDEDTVNDLLGGPRQFKDAEELTAYILGKPL